jgi:PAS domain S-box-containing protein
MTQSRVVHRTLTILAQDKAEFGPSRKAFMAGNLTMAAFFRSKTGAGYVSFLCLSAALSAALAYGGYYLSREGFTRSKSEEKITALQLVDAFVADYSANRGKFMSGDAPVPATFRAQAIEHFNKMRDASSALRLLMVGPAGRQIATPPADDDMADTVRRFSEAAKPQPETRFITLNGEVSFRTLYPSVASQQSCVDCHNKLQPGANWQLHDVLGAFVIDVPAGAFLTRTLWQNAGLGVATFLLLGLVGLYISVMHFRQLAEREATQTRLKESEERFRDFAETASDWFWEQDENLRFSYLSNAVHARSGLPVNEHIGKTRREVVHLGVTEEQWRAHDADLAARRPFHDFQFQRQGPDGAIHHIRISGRPVFADGRFTGYRGTARNVTDEVEAEIELERRVGERTAELRNVQEELLRKERLATLGQLTATVSHELRNPLGVIRNTMFTIAETAQANGLKLERAFGRIERSIGRCDTIITDLLDYTRIRQLRREKFPLDSWLAEVLDEQQIPQRIALVREFAAGDTIVSVDADRLRRVIINLVENAAQAIEGDREESNSAPPRICVRTRMAIDRVEIEIEDSGPGIPPDIFKRIFEPLFSTKGFGVGLGLPTVKQIMEHHGGNIEMSSEPGRGTRALIWLPLMHETEIAA